MIITDVFEPTPVFVANMKSTADVVVNQGGTYSGKTYSILQKEILIAATRRKTRTTVVAQDVPNLTRGAIRDFEDIIGYMTDNVPKGIKWMFGGDYNKTKKTHTFPNGSFMEFASFRDWQGAKAGKRDRLFVNEVNGVPERIFDELSTRTDQQVTVDFNPNTAFWVHDRFLNDPNAHWIYSNYSHNPFNSEKKVREIIAKGRRNPEWWQVYGLGKTGNTSEVIFPDVNWISDSDMPDHRKCTSVVYGIDWGYSPDPFALSEVCLHNDELYIKLHAYEWELGYEEIAERIVASGARDSRRQIVCDNDKQAIRELRNTYRINMKAAQKEAGSIEKGIRNLKNYKLNIVANDWAQIEQRNYKWKLHRETGRATNKPADGHDHFWDATRYAARYLSNISSMYSIA